jgi:heterodisulfide reductase subunit A-like polyferredoxin
MGSKGYGLFICLCSEREFLPPEEIEKVREGLGKYELGFVLMHPWLCSKDSGLPILSKLSEDVEKVIVVGCHKKAQKLLFQEAIEAEKLVPVNLRDSSAEDVLKELDGILSVQEGEPRTEWFPVIDKEKCNNCLQCMEFCLFGVYDVDDDGQLYVKNPYNCKDNCPACARVCAKLAIVFPKCVEGWMAGADVPPPEYLKKARSQMLKRMMEKRKEYLKDNDPDKDKRSVKEMLEEFAREE